MRKLPLLLFAATIAIFALYAEPALAQGQMKAQGPYIGGSLGGSWLQTEDGAFDDVVLGWKALSGFRSKFFAVEADYRSLGSVKGALEGVTSTTKGFQSSLLLILPAGPVDFFGRGGAFFWKNKVSAGDISSEITGTAFAYGGGIALRLGSFSLRAEYEKSLITELNDPWMATGGITIAF